MAFLVWAFLDPRFRDAEGFLKSVFDLPIAAGAALLILGWAVTGQWLRFASWFALALVGQAAALHLIEAGTAIHWQHYKSFTTLLTGASPLLLLFIAAQTILVLVGLKMRWSRIRTWATTHFQWWQLLGVALVFVLSSAAVQRDVSLYVGDLFLAAFVQTVNLGNIVLMVGALPEDALLALKRKIERLFGRPGMDGSNEADGVDRFAVLAAVWVFIFAAVLGFLSYEWHPHITDEVAYLYQARFLANGTITLPAPPVPDAFNIYLMEFKGDQWFPPTPPGWPAMLAIGVRLGIPGLINPLLAGLNVLLTYRLLQELYDRRTARVAILLLAVSPWYVFMAMNFMTHTSTLTCALAAAVAVIQARKTGNFCWAWVAGAAIGIASLIRPLDGLMVGALIGLWVIGIGGQRLNPASIAAFGIGVVMLGALVFPFNQILTGKPTVFPLNAYVDSHFGPGKNDLGFGPRGFGWPVQPFAEHTPIGALINANLNTFSINVELFGWSIGSLLFAAVLVFSGALRKSDYLMITVCVAIFAPYFFYYFSGGPDFGARYWFLMLVPLVALTIRGIQFLESKVDCGGVQVMIAVLALVGLTLVNYFPWRAIDKYHHYWGMRPDIVNLAKEYHFGKSLVLIRGSDPHPDFASAAIYNPLDWNADAPVYAWDRSPSIRAQLLKAFSDRTVWIVDAPSITHSGYKVVEGPLISQELATRSAAP